MIGSHGNLIVIPPVFNPSQLFAASEKGVWYDPSDLATVWQDSAGTTPGAIEAVVGKLDDKSGNGKHLTQSTAGAKPILSARKNVLLATATMATQNFTTQAIAYTLSFTGTGTITLTGASGAGPLVGTGASDRVSLTFTPIAGTLTLTVSGSVTLAQLELGSTLTAYQDVVTATNYTSTGFPHYLLFDGVDDNMASAAIDFSASALLTVWQGQRTKQSSGIQVLTELSAAYSSNAGAFCIFGELNADALSIYWRGTADAGFKQTPLSILPQVQVMSFDLSQSTRELEMLARKNGATASGTYLGAASAGTGNFGNYALFVGMRNAASFPFAGRMYSLIIRGGASTTTERDNGETWVNGQTGAY